MSTDDLAGSNFPRSLPELVRFWKHDLSELTCVNGPEIACFMVGRLAGNDHWDDWDGKNALVAEAFALVADLELPNELHLNSISVNEDRPKNWNRVRKILSLLADEVAT